MNPISSLSFLYAQKVLGGGFSLSSAARLPDAIDTFSAKGLLASTLLDPVEVNNTEGAIVCHNSRTRDIA